MKFKTIQIQNFFKAPFFRSTGFLVLLLGNSQISFGQEKSEVKKENCPVISESSTEPTSTRIEFDGSIKTGLRSFFGEKKGDRVHEALVRLDTEFTIDKDFRVSLGGETGYANNSEDLVSKQEETDRYAAYARTDFTTFGDSFESFPKSGSPSNSFGWALDVRRVENDFNGTKERNSLSVLPFVYKSSHKSGNEVCSGSFGIGTRYEEASFDSDFLSTIGTPTDSTQNFAGLYCEGNFSVLGLDRNDKPGIGFDVFGSLFFDGVSDMQQWKLGAELSTPLFRESNCRIALSWSVEDNDDPSGQSQFVGVFGIIPIGGKPSYPKRLY